MTGLGDIKRAVPRTRRYSKTGARMVSLSRTVLV